MVKGEGDSGLVGVVLFCPFLFASIYHAILANHRLQNIQNPKVLFYISLSLYALLELIYFAGLFYYHQSTGWTFCCHIVALCLYVYAFSIVIYLWGSTMSFGKQNFVAPYYAGVVVVTLNVIISVVAIVFVSFSGSFKEYEENYWIMNFVATIMHSACLMLLSVSMLFYGIKLQLKLAKTTVKSAPGKTTKLAIILRINGMLAICNICFFLRVVVLGLLSSDILMHKTYTDKQISTFGWYIMSNWIPTLIPAVTLLIMLRVKSSPTSSKHMRTEDQWRDTDLTVESGAVRASGAGGANGVTRYSTKRQYVESERDSQLDEGINPVHRSSPKREGSLHIETKSGDMDPSGDYDEDDEDEEGY